MKILILFLLASCSLFRNQNEEVPIPGSLEEAVSSDARAPENEDRDEFQHPMETLRYFGLRPEMTVVEIEPGAGYYAEILAPYLAKSGLYMMAVPRLPSRPAPYMIENERKLQDIILRNSAIQSKIKFLPFEPLDKRNRIKPEQADLVVSFNHVHSWVSKNEAPEAFKFCFDVLKRGGVLGIVQHRVKNLRRKVPNSGYMTEGEVINLARQAGFRFAGRSEINANPKDTADYPKGVWVLPPTYRLGEQDKDRYEDIGESDRMTLKFVKP